MLLKKVHVIFMLCAPVSITFLQATEMMHSAMDTLSIQKEIPDEISNNCVSKKQLWESIPKT